MKMLFEPKVSIDQGRSIKSCAETFVVGALRLERSEGVDPSCESESSV
jgi:hypothetical protein